MMPKRETADSVKPHTEAKLQFYTRYLERYLKILLRTSAVNRINIYDMFCGQGIYSDGKTGSAIRAVEAIWRAESSNELCKPINLHLNDLDLAKVSQLEQTLSTRQSNDKKFQITYSSYEAFYLLEKLVQGFKRQDKKTRNLVFIDPYGYKSIRKKTLEQILENEKSELIIFLPIEQMYRFRNMAIDDIVENSYKPLKELVEQFQLDVEAINSEKDFINSFAKSLVFNNSLYATSYAIKNHTGHYYAMFFVTANLLGLEKILEVKWELDNQEGEGFSGTVQQQDVFLEAEKLSSLQKSLKEYLSSSSRTNIEVYNLILNNGFLPKHANKIFRDWQEEGALDVYDVLLDKPARKKTFKLNYKDANRDFPLLKFSLN